MNVRHDKKARGFTIAELLVGIAILAIGSTALYMGLAFGFRSIALTREERRATQILLQTTETLRLYTWEQLHDANFLPSQFRQQYDPGNTNNPGSIYTGHIAVAACPTTFEAYSANLSLVTITLDWATMGMPRHREIQTFVTRYGLQNYVF